MIDLNFVKQNISTESCSFYVIEDNKISIAEISIIPEELALLYVNETKIKNYDKEKIANLIHQSTGVFFFNRLNVHKLMQNKGYGKLLMRSLTEHMNNTNSFLLNTANAYGDMSQRDLISFYEKSGMKLISRDGLLIYHKEIENILSTNEASETKKRKIKP